MAPIFYRLCGTKCIEVECPTGKEIVKFIASKECIPEEELRLSVNGRPIREDMVVNENLTVDVNFRILGGKGGFGNLMKKRARITNPNAVLDFSFCRDLNGRRMLYVNAEVAIKKWKERMAKLEELKETNPDATLADIEMDDPNGGIAGWYCDVPGWAEGLKRSRANFMRMQKKQKMCERWWKAHQGKVPPNADRHYGCPRRDQCEYAHGLEELTGTGRQAFLREQEQLKKEKEREAIESYVNYKDMADDAMTAVEAGLQLRQKGKKNKSKRDILPLDLDDMGFGHRAKRQRASKSVPTTTTLTDLTDLTVSKGEGDVVMMDSLTGLTSGVASMSGEKVAKRLTELSGHALMNDDGIIMAITSFPSIQLGNIAVTTGRYYYEFYVLTEGLVQAGWAGRNHGCDEENANGVGDDENSWGFDIARGQKWHAEEEEEKEEEEEESGIAYGRVCHPGDIVGVLFDADVRTLSYSINGEDMGIAFENVNVLGGMFPVISLEKEEAVLVNLGQFQFEHEPLMKATSVWEYAKKVKKDL